MSQIENNNTNNKDSFDDINIREVIFTLRKNVKTIGIALGTAIILLSFYLLITLPTYVSVGKIYLEEDVSSKINPLLEMAMGKEKNFIENEIELLTSRTVSEKTIQKLLSLDEELYLLRNRKEDGSLIRNSMRKILLLTPKSYENIQEVYGDSLQTEIIKDLRDNWIIENIENTEILNVSYESNDPEESALIVNTLISVYQEQDKYWENNELLYLQKFLDNQLKIKKEELFAIETELKTFQEENKIFVLDKDSEIILEQLKTVETEYFTSDAEIKILNERKKYYSNELSSGEAKLANQITNTIDSQLFVLRNELGVLESEYTSTLALEGPNHPALKNLQSKIDNLKLSIESQTNRLIKTQISASSPIEYRQALIDTMITIKAQEAGIFVKNRELKKQVENYENQLKSLPKKYLVLSRLERDRIILDQTYSLMKQKYEEARISEASQLGKVKIIDSAIPTYQKATPRVGLAILISLFFGLTIGLIAVLVKEFFDNTIKSIEEIENRGLSLLAIIPNLNLDSKKKRARKNKNAENETVKNLERRLILHEDPKSPIAEAYRGLRTSISLGRVNHSSSPDQGISLLVTSSGPGEGKSTTAMNLAITYANLGKKVIIVDGDLRKPVVHKVFNLEKSVGITSYMAGNNDDKIEKYINKSDVTENLFVLCAGPVPPNPSEILGSEKMKNMINELKNKFDVVIIDTPPLIAVTDAFIIGTYVKQFLLVIRSGVTHKGALDRSIKNLQYNGVKISGCILNAASEATSYGGGYYYDYYQYYYGTDENRT